MKATAVLLGLACTVLIATTEAVPNNCCGAGSRCGNYYGGECCGGLSCQSSVCIAVEYQYQYQYPAYRPYGKPYGYYGGYKDYDQCNGCGCPCDTCNGCYD